MVDIEHLSNRIDRVRNKVVEQKISLNSCLTRHEVEEFETRYQIHLPQDYRQFLTEIGNGGSGPPYYGLVPLTETVKGKEFRPDLPFPLEKYWVWEGEVSWEKGQPEILEPVFLHGHLNLGTDRCGYDWLLIVNGSEYGKIWSRADVGAQPCAPQRDFLSWYEYWLDGNDDWWKDLGIVTDMYP